MIMKRYKIATKTDVLRIKIAKEIFNEIEDYDGIRDIPSWEIFEKCLEQHKQIAELEKKLAEKERIIRTAENLLEEREKEADEQLKKQAEYREKSLKEKDEIIDNLNKENELLKGKEQDKISFAIKQFEKLQIELNQELNPVDIYVIGAIEKHIKDLN